MHAWVRAQLCLALFYFYLFIFWLFLKKFLYFWLPWVLIVAWELSLVVVSGGYSSLQCTSLVTLKYLGSSWTRDWTHIPCTGRQILNFWTTREVSACLTLLWFHALKPARLLWSWDFLGKNTRMSCHFLLQEIFSIQESNPRLLCWQVDSLPLSYLGSPGNGNSNPGLSHTEATTYFTALPLD